MTLINCEINLILTWSQDFVISSATEKTKISLLYQVLKEQLTKIRSIKIVSRKMEPIFRLLNRPTFARI